MIPFHIPTPQNCHIHICYGTNDLNGNDTDPWQSWTKPVGVSHIYMLLIGGGGDCSASQGGGSGAVTVWYGAAQHVPDSLRLLAPSNTLSGIRASQVQASIRGYPLLLQANGSGGPNGGTAFSPNEFTASGFFQSTAGQAGATSGAIVASATTFLSGGTFIGNPTANYGYGGTGPGYFLMRPIIVGKGGGINTNSLTSYGCGAPAGNTGSNSGGGPGLILIASW